MHKTSHFLGESGWSWGRVMGYIDSTASGCSPSVPLWELWSTYTQSSAESFWFKFGRFEAGSISNLCQIDILTIFLGLSRVKFTIEKIILKFTCETRNRMLFIINPINDDK